MGAFFQEKAINLSFVQFFVCFGAYRIFTSGTIEYRYIQEIRFGERKPVTYWIITTNPELLPKNQLGALFARILHPGEKRTEYVMTNLRGDVAQKLGNLYGFRN